MTPQERQMVTELFDRLARLESSPRDAEAERVIADGASRAPHALYALVQTALVQDEALRRADARIRELSGEGDTAPSGGGFLDSMRNAISGHGSVPSVRPAPADSRWNTGGALGGATSPQSQPYAAPAQSPGFGGSFLGTAAASAAGVIGGALLFNSIGSLFGGHHGGSAFGDVPPAGSPGSPWDSNAAANDLSRDAGLNDIGGGRSAGLFDGSDNDDAGVDLADSGGDFGGDFGGDGGGDSA